MDNKNNKVYLPNNYEQYLQQKKKNTKPGIIAKQQTTA